MQSNAERRVCGRVVCGGFILFTRLNDMDEITADLLDLSEDGLGFLSTAELKPGSSLWVRVEHAEWEGTKRLAKPPVKSLGIVEVKWCRPVGDRWNEKYATGVKYLLI